MTKQEWHADLNIDEQLIKKILGEQFPNLPIKKIQFLAEGWDNRAYLINQQFIFRFPRRQAAIEFMERENKLLTNLSSSFALAIPTPEFIGQSSEEYPSPFQGYKLIQGTPAYLADLSVQDRIDSLPVLAKFLKSLHNIDEEQALKLGAQEQAFDQVEVDKIITTLCKRVDEIIAKKIIPIDKKIFHQEIKTTRQLELNFYERCLTHSDLDWRHLLFEKNKLVGVIDWGDVSINNKAIDLSIIWNFYPLDNHQQFFEIYGYADPVTWQFARFLALECAFIHILYGHDIGDTKLVIEAISAIQRINSRLIMAPRNGLEPLTW